MTDRHEAWGDALWDPAAGTHGAVDAIESRLRPLRVDPVATPLDAARLGPRAPSARNVAAPPRRRVRPLVWAVAAGLALVCGGAALVVRQLSWADGRPWPILATDGGGGPLAPHDALRVGQPLTTTAAAGALVRIARIGAMQVQPSTDLSLRATGRGRHRLVLRRGALDVQVWAPPGTFAVATPAGEVVDAGCAFFLTVTGNLTTVRVTSGWVQLRNGHGESLVPQGASSEMAEGRAPRVAVFDDGDEVFRTGVRAFESGATADLRFVDRARARDVYTLLMLMPEATPRARLRLAARAAALSPPPPTASIGAVVAGDTAALWRWQEGLGLPPPKAWWLKWREARFWF